MQVALYTGGCHKVCYRAGLRHHRYDILPGGVFVFPSGFDLTGVQLSGMHEAILVQVDGQLVDQVVPGRDTLDTGVVVPQHDVSEERVAALMRAMQEEIEAGCPSGRLYAESLTLALTSYIASHFAVKGNNKWSYGGRLSRHQVERVMEFIYSSLEQELSLVELARQARLSPRHFARLFKNTLGVTPHQYVMRERVERAKWLLAGRRLQVSEISLSLGFGNQSYFTQAFHKVTGTTPKRYQRDS
jgi:AraC family transcriptional regulator